ncbi:MAG: ABC transporter permease [Bacteroidales bacterium]|nr:ABC transporter permease [Bacteroidales bacterium]
MNRFIAFVRKEFKHLLRDYRTVLIIFGIPIAQLLLFGHVITTEIKDAEVGILDLSRDEVSTKLTQKLLGSGYFKVSEDIHNVNQIENLFRKGKIRELIVLEENFGNKLRREGKAQIQIITDASDPNTAGILSNYTQSIVARFFSEEMAPGLKPLIQVDQRMFYNEELRSANMFVPGTIALILMLISALMTSISIAREKELGTMEILLVSPLRPLQIIMGKVVPYLVLSVIMAVVIIGVGFFIFHVPIRGSLILLFGLLTLFILLALALGILISTVAKTQQVAMLISLVGLMLPTMLLSGFIFPIENMPKALQYLSIAMPPRWFLAALKDIMLKGVGLAYVWDEILILTGMLIGFTLISVRKFQIRLES